MVVLSGITYIIVLNFCTYNPLLNTVGIKLTSGSPCESDRCSSPGYFFHVGFDITRDESCSGSLRFPQRLLYPL